MKRELDGGVTPKQFNEWLKNNLKYTWYHGKEGSFFNLGNGGSAIFKYFYPKLDTRDMKIFRIDYSGGLPDGYVDFRDCKKGETILDLLDQRLKEALER